MSDPRYSPGDEQSASWLNSLWDAIKACRIFSDGSILVGRGPGGQTLRVNLPQEADFRITGGSQPYAGVEQRPTSGGGWADLIDGRVVTTTSDPLYERNANRTVGSVVVHAERDGGGCWIFDRNSCAAGTTTTTTTTTTTKSSPAFNPFPLRPSSEVFLVDPGSLSPEQGHRSTVAPLSPLAPIGPSAILLIGDHQVQPVQPAGAP